MERAAVYLRVSTAGQERDGVSLDAQLAMAEQFCERRGFKLTRRYVDTMSGQSDARPGLAQLEADIASKGGPGFEHLLVYRLDRLWRNSAAYHALLARLERAGIGLASLTEPFDASVPIGRFLLTILVGLAELEVGITSARLADSFAYRASIGRVFVGRYVTFGYQYRKAHTDAEGARHPGQLSINHAEAVLVRWLFETYVRVKSMSRVIQEADAQGITVRGKPLCNTTISRFIQNPLYKGELATLRTKTVRRAGRKVAVPRPASEHVLTPGYPAIVPVELWDRAAEIRVENHDLSPRGQFVRRHWAWGGRLRCASCGFRLSRDTEASRSTFWRCRSRHRLGASRCAEPAKVREESLNGVVADALFGAIDDALRGRRPRGAAPKKPAVSITEAVARALADIDAQRERVQDMFQAGDLARDKYRARMAKLDAEAEAQRGRLATSPASVAPPPIEQLQGLHDAWLRMADTPEIRGEMLGLVIQHVAVAVDEDRRRTATIHFKPLDLPGWPGAVEVQLEDYKALGNAKRVVSLRRFYGSGD